MSSEFLKITPEKSLNGLNNYFFKDIYIKFKKTELQEISWLPHVWIHFSLRMQECRDETELYNYQWIQPSNNKFINAILGGMLDLPWLKHIYNNKYFSHKTNGKQYLFTFYEPHGKLFEWNWYWWPHHGAFAAYTRKNDKNAQVTYITRLGEG